MSGMNCAWCRRSMDYLHGHAACVDPRCPMFGQNQAACCDGETADNCPAATSDIAARSVRAPAS
jgi:hypothetical protein